MKIDMHHGNPGIPERKKAKSNFVPWTIGIVILTLMMYLTFLLPSFKGTLGHETSLPRITSTYKEVFPDYDSTKIKPSYTFFSPYKAPKSSFFVEDGKGRILVYKIGEIEMGQPLSNIVTVGWTTANPNHTGKIYDESYRSANMVFSDLEEKTVPGKHIYIDISGRLVKNPIISDSLLYYHIDLDRLGGHYSKKSAYDFLAKKTNRLIGQQLEVQLAFIRKNSRVYMLMLSPVTMSDTRLAQNQLLTLLSKTN